jgi:hypothetical protein
VTWAKLCQELRPDLDVSAVLELRATLAHPPES